MRLSRILKYPLTLGSEQRLQVPVGARVLALQLQAGRPVLWLLTDVPTHPSGVQAQEEWLVRCVGTGWEVWGLDEWTHLGTVQTTGGFVWHFWRQEGA